MKIRKTPLPLDSAAARIPEIDYSDCYRAQLPGDEPVPPARLMAAFWTTTPGWLALLFKLRNLLVRPFGLKTGEKENFETIRAALEAGRDCGFLSVVENTPSEMVIRLDDKHLTAFFSILIRDRSAYTTTLVRYHNKLGVAYFTLIRPFHALIVKCQLRSILRDMA